AAYVDRDLAGQVAAGDGRRNFSDVSYLAGQIRSHQVHVVGKVFPRTADVRHLRLASELPFGADFARDPRDLGGEGVQLVHHGVDGVLELESVAFNVDGNLAGEVSSGHSGGHFGNIAHLAGKVRGHKVDVVGQVLPRAGDAGNARLAAQLPFGADFARDTGYFSREAVELVHHGVDGVL